MGRRLYMIHMLLLPFLPIIALVVQNSMTLKHLLYYRQEVQSSFDKGRCNFIVNLYLARNKIFPSFKTLRS